jgi:hypothetical protein
MGLRDSNLGVPGPGFVDGDIPLRARPDGEVFGTVPSTTSFRVLERSGDAVRVLIRSPKLRFEEAQFGVVGWVPLSVLREEPDLRPAAPVVVGRLVTSGLKKWALGNFKVYVPSFQAEPHYEADVREDGTFVVQAGLPTSSQRAQLVSVEARSPGGAWAGRIERAPAFLGGGDGIAIPVARTEPISGVVKTPAGAVVPGALVELDGGDSRAQTWTDGTFLLRALPGKRHRLTAAGLSSDGLLPNDGARLATAPSKDLVLRTRFPRPVFGAVPRDAKGHCASAFVTFLLAGDEQNTRTEEVTVPVAPNCRFTLDDLPEKKDGRYKYIVRTVGRKPLTMMVDEVLAANGHPRPVCFARDCVARQQGSLWISVVDAHHVLLQPSVTVNASVDGSLFSSCETRHGQCYIHNLDPEMPVDVELRQGERVLSHTVVVPVAGVREVVLPAIVVVSRAQVSAVSN